MLGHRFGKCNGNNYSNVKADEMHRSPNRVCAFACQGYLDRSALLTDTCCTPHCGVLSASEDVLLRVRIIDMWMHVLGLILNRQG